LSTNAAQLPFAALHDRPTRPDKQQQVVTIHSNYNFSSPGNFFAEIKTSWRARSTLGAPEQRHDSGRNTRAQASLNELSQLFDFLQTNQFINDDGLTITVIIEMLSQITQVIFDNGNSKRYSST
jgi:hypothetical protein